MNDPYIYYTQQPILSSKFCNDLINRFEHDDRKRPQSTHPLNTELKQKSYDLDISQYDDYQQENHAITLATHQSLYDYEQHCNSTQPRQFHFTHDMSQWEGFVLQRTLPMDEGVWWHTDHRHVCLVGNNKSTVVSRVLSCIIYLNTVDEGGHTEFANGQLIQPIQGHCLIFPSTWTYIHRGLPPAHGNKYILVGMWCTNQLIHSPKVENSA